MPVIGISVVVGLSLLAGLTVPLVGAVPVLIAVIVLLAAALVLFLLTRPVAGLALLALLVAAYPTFNVVLGGIPIYPWDILASLYLGALLLSRGRGSWGRAEKLIVVYVLTLIPSWLVQMLRLELVLEPTYGLLRSVFAVCVVFLALSWLRTEKAVSSLVLALALGTLVTSLVALAQAWWATTDAVRDLLLLVQPDIEGSYRVYPVRSFAFFQAPTTLAGFLAPVLPLLLAGLTSRASLTYRLVLGAALLAGSLALVVTYSRQGFVALLPALALLAVLHTGLTVRSVSAAALALALVFSIVPSGTLVHQDLFQDRLSALLAPTDDTNIAFRLDAQENFFNSIAEDPVFFLTGRGFATRNIFLRGLIDASTWDSITVGMNENSFLLTVVNHGFAAGLTYVLLLGGLLLFSVQQCRRAGREASALAVGLTASLAAILALHVTDRYFSESMFMKEYLWLMVGLLLASLRLIARPQTLLKAGSPEQPRGVLTGDDTPSRSREEPANA